MLQINKLYKMGVLLKLLLILICLMDNNKANDLVSLAMVNPDASLGDLMASGITANNTSIRPE
nr:MAG TPA: hypothetical protein [Caudoviricetes sp.]